MNRHAKILFPVLVFLLAFVLFAPSIRYKAIDIDDVQYTVESPEVTSGLLPRNIIWAFSSPHQTWYAPLLWISLMADSSLFGAHYASYHFTNVFLHAANAAFLCASLLLVLAYAFPRRPSPVVRAAIAAVAALLWALHPLRVESVAWIAERKDVLSGFFFLWAVHRYLVLRRPAALAAPAPDAPAPRLPSLFSVALLMLLGLLAKSMLIVLPPILLLLDVFPLRRAPLSLAPSAFRAWLPLLREKALLIVLAIAGAVLTVVTHRDVAAAGPDQASFLFRAALVAPAYLAHIAKTVWPADLSLFYPIVYPSRLRAAFDLLILLAILFAAFRLRRAFPEATVGILWFLIALLPVVRGVRFDEQNPWADRYTYFAAIGLSVWIAAAAARFAASPRRAAASLALLSAIALAAAVRTARYLPLWADRSVMAPVLIQSAPDNPRAVHIYAKYLAESGHPDESIPYYEKIVGQHPICAYNLATVYLEVGRFRDAIHVARQVCDGPTPPTDAFLTLGVAYLQDDRASDAIPPLKTATSLTPQNAFAWQTLLRAAIEDGDDALAASCRENLRRIGVTDVMDLNGLVDLYTRSWGPSGPRLCWPFFENNIRRFPDNLKLLNNAAWLLANTPSNPPVPLERAIGFAQAAVDASPSGLVRANSLDTLATALAANGRFQDAADALSRALDEIPPDESGAEVLRTTWTARRDACLQSASAPL